MRAINDITSYLRKYDVEIILLFWMIVGGAMNGNRFLLEIDPYGVVWCNQWSCMIAFLTLPARWTSLLTGSNEIILYYKDVLFILNNLMIYYTFYRFFTLLKKRGPYILTLLIVPAFFVLCQYTYAQHTDNIMLNSLLATMTILFYCATGERAMNNKTLLFVSLLILVCVTIRKNAILLLPVLLWMTTKQIKTSRRNKGIYIGLMVLLSVFWISPQMESILGLSDAKGNSVYKLSDIICMRTLKGEPIEEDLSRRIPSAQKGLFMQYYDAERSRDGLDNLWEDEIMEDPSVFIVSRSINYAQLVFGGILPKNLQETIEMKYPNVILPRAEHIAKGFRGQERNMILTILQARVPFIILFLSTVAVIIIVMHKGKRLSKSFNRYSLWLYAVIVTYYFSFLPFTPTPDFRFKIMTSLLGLVIVCTLLDEAISSLKNKGNIQL